MSEPRTLKLPLSREDAESLSLGETVMIDGSIAVTAGIPTHNRILEKIRAGEDLPIDLVHAAFFHLGSYNRETENGFEVLYMNPTTSTRFNPMMPEIIRHFELRCVGGKGGLDAECAEALKSVGGVYLSFLGGGAPLISAAIDRIKTVVWEDLVSHYRLVELEVRNLGPLTVAIDAHGGSLYDKLAEGAKARRQEILDKIASAREKAQKPG